MWSICLESCLKTCVHHLSCKLYWKCCCRVSPPSGEVSELSADGNLQQQWQGSGPPRQPRQSVKQHAAPLVVFALSQSFFSPLFQTKEEISICVFQVTRQTSKREWRLWPTSSRYSVMTTTWSCSRWVCAHAARTLLCFIVVHNSDSSLVLCVSGPGRPSVSSSKRDFPPRPSLKPARLER